MGIFNNKQKSVNNTGPWAPQQRYITKGFGEAENWYDGGGPQYFGGQTLADRSPLINQSEDAMMGYAGGQEFSDMMDRSYGATAGMLDGGNQGYGALFGDPNVGDAYTQAISGDINPYAKNAADAADQEMMESYSGMGGAASQIRNAAIGSGQHGGGTRQQLMDQTAQDNLQENMLNSRYGMYANASENAQNRMLQGLGQAESARAGMGAEGINRYSSAMNYLPQQYNMEINAMGVPGQVGQSRQGYDQAQIDDERARWDYEQNLPLSNLQNYMGVITGNYGSQGNTVNESRDSGYNIGKGVFNDTLGTTALAFGGIPGLA